MQKGVLFFFTISSLIVSILLIELFLNITKYQPKKIFWMWTSGNTEESWFTLDAKKIWSPREKVFTKKLTNNVVSSEKNFKILLIGDSFIFGHGVKNSQTVGAYLQKFYPDKITILNAGALGYGIDQEYIFLKKTLIPSLKPDLIVWSINQNDFYDTKHRTLFILFRDKLVRFPAFFHGIYIQGLINTTIGKKFPKSLLLNILSYNLQGMNPAALLQKQSDQIVINKIKIMVKKIKADHGISVVVAQTPNQFYFSILRDTHQDLSKNNRRYLNELGKELTYYFDANDVIKENLNSPFEWTGFQNLFLNETEFPFGFKHLSPEGNYQYAKSIYQNIEVNISSFSR